MNAIDILKGIIKGNATGSKRVEQINERSGGDPFGRSSGRSHEPTDPQDVARQLEDLLGIGKKKMRDRAEERIPRAEPVRRSEPERYREPVRHREPAPRRRQPRYEQENDDAVTLIRAMCNAAKVDGEIERTEKEAILNRIGNVGREEVEFVRSELSAPLDLEHFCDTVPPRLAEQVYTFSVLAIKLDTLREAAYLGRLSSGLELDPRTCNEIHERFDAPCLFAW